jgi:hypothetical protein
MRSGFARWQSQDTSEGEVFVSGERPRLHYRRRLTKVNEDLVARAAIQGNPAMMLRLRDT